MLAQTKKGQAFLELLPALLVIVVVLTTSLFYFGAMREAAMREEAVRNLTFAKIANSGTLTTPGDQMLSTISSPMLLGPELSPNYNYSALAVGRNPFIGATSNCFLVRPELPENTAVKMSTQPSFLKAITINTYAIINRRPVPPLTCR
jgi:hypothetical protein